MVGIGVIVAIMIFLWMKNKQENRAIHRHNRMIEKQEELMEMLRNKNNKKEEDES